MPQLSACLNSLSAKWYTALSTSAHTTNSSHTLLSSIAFGRVSLAADEIPLSFFSSSLSLPLRQLRPMICFCRPSPRSLPSQSNMPILFQTARNSTELSGATRLTLSGNSILRPAYSYASAWSHTLVPAAILVPKWLLWYYVTTTFGLPFPKIYKHSSPTACTV